jgi:hypothetical protein
MLTSQNRVKGKMNNGDKNKKKKGGSQPFFAEKDKKRNS